MLWLISNTLNEEPAYKALIAALIHLEQDYRIVKTIPFTDILIDPDTDTSKALTDADQLPQLEIDASDGVVIFGTITLAKLAKGRGWLPGSYISPNLRYDNFAKGYGEDLLLNPSARICKFKDLPTISTSMFVRPVEDSKSFSGKVFTPDEFAKLVKIASEITEGDVFNAETEIIISSPKVIYSEWRLFVVDGKIITASRYKLGQKVIYSNVIDPEVIDFGKKCIEIWQPNEAYVLDIALTEDGPKVVETNCFNSSGFYHTDPGMIVRAVLDFETGRRSVEIR